MFEICWVDGKPSNRPYTAMLAGLRLAIPIVRADPVLALKSFRDIVITAETLSTNEEAVAYTHAGLLSLASCVPGEAYDWRPESFRDIATVLYSAWPLDVAPWLAGLSTMLKPAPAHSEDFRKAELYAKLQALPSLVCREAGVDHIELMCWLYIVLWGDHLLVAPNDVPFMLASDR